MSGVDFSNLGGVSAADSATEPRRIFAALPAKAPKYGYPRDVQTEVWDAWHERRTEADLIIKMNTGGGKTVVGLVLLKSCLNEGAGPVAYFTPDRYLSDQVRAEADALGIPTTTEPRSAAFQRGEAVLVTNIYKLINGKSQFGVEGRGQPIDVGTLLIDDAHACLATVQSQFTLSIPNAHDTYSSLLELFAEDLKSQSASGYLDVIDGDPVAALRLPYWAWQSRQSEVLSILHPHRDDDEFMWEWPLLVDALPMCEVGVSVESIEVRPPCPPLERVPSFRNARRRIYLTATLADDSVLVTHFGADPSSVESPITPRTAGDIGDRMILTPMETHPDATSDDVRSLLVDLSAHHNVVVIVPSRARANEWEPFADQVHDADTIHEGVEALRRGRVGLTVLINKYDGIDLPHNACRVLAIDGLPEAYGPLDRLEAACLTDSEAMVSRQVQRIEQGMGRGVRSNDDHCVVLLLGSRLTQRLYQGRMVDMFSPATREQLNLSRQVARMLEDRPFADVRAVIDQCLDRDAKWVAASRGALDGLAYEPARLAPHSVAERRAFDLATSGQHRNASQLLASAASGAVDAKQVGWLKQRAASYAFSVDPVAADQLQSAALASNRSLLKPQAGVPYERVRTTSSQGNLCGRRLSAYESPTALVLGVQALLDDLLPSTDPTRVPAFEQAFHDLGEHLGIEAQRPERDTGEGPDVLWSLGELKYWVVECKSGVSTDTISKHDAAQLSHSVDWFEGKYDASCAVTPIMIHRSHTLHRQASARNGMRVVTFDLLADLRNAVRQFAQSVSTADLGDATSVGERLKAAGLNAASLSQKWTKKPKPPRR